MQILSLFSIAAVLATAAAKPTVYMIRHGEKPDDGNGLSATGEQRAQCLRNVFGANSGYNIGHIMAQNYKSDGKRQRPYDTVKPLANDLGMGVDVSCERDDEKCVKKVVKNYSGKGNILICWSHDNMKDIAEEIGAKNAKKYDSDHFDLIWTLYPDYKEIVISSENCPGLD